MEETLYGAIALVVIIFGALVSDSYQCSAQWENSGFSSKWGVMSGCQINKDGHWIPATAYREIQ